MVKKRGRAYHYAYSQTNLDYNRLSWNRDKKRRGIFIDLPADMEVDSQANGTQVFHFWNRQQQAGDEFAMGIDWS